MPDADQRAIRSARDQAGHTPLSRNPGRIVFALILLLAATILAGKLGYFFMRVPLDAPGIRHLNGRSYQTAIPPLRSPWPLLRPEARADSGDAPAASSIALLEDNRPLGPAHSEHARIVGEGGGRFSHWQDSLLFSASDGSSPLTNGRSYSLAVRLLPAPSAVVAWFGLVLLGLALSLHRARRLGRAKAWWYRAGLACLACATPLAAYAGLDAWLRAKLPVDTPVWPTVFDPAVGVRFQPGAAVQHTNFVDFAVRDRANSIGFLDAEHATAKLPGVFRILLLGDSFVEAAQVPLADRLQTRLEEELGRRLPGLGLEVIALGYSGCGTGHELAFYEAYGRRFRPDLTIVLVANNDLANGSPLLEAARSGWHPRHPPRPFFEVRDPGPGFERIGIDPDWDRFRLPEPPAAPRPPALADRLDGLAAGSRVYRWVRAHFGAAQKWAIADYQALVGFRLEILRRDPQAAVRLEGYALPGDLDLMFFAADMPRVFDEAVDIAAHALGELRRAVESDGGRLIAAAVDGCTLRMVPPDVPGVAADRLALRGLSARGYFEKVAAAAARAGVPLLDLYPEFVRRGDPRKSHFAHDGHWNAAGHRWAAEALADYMVSRGEIK